MKIDGVVYFVTGGASGLGLATVYALIKLGAYVAILDTNVADGQRIAKEIGAKAMFVHCDIVSEKSVDEAIAASDRAFGDRVVGGVVHCAGVGSVASALNRDGSATSLDHFKKVVDINLTGSFNVASRIAARIIKSNPKPTRANPVTEDRGVIIMVSSVSHTEAQAGMCAYASSKGGVVSLTLPLAREFSRFGIRVQTIVPTMFATPMGSNIGNPKLYDSLIDATLFPRRFGVPDEFAHMAIFIIENSMMNGGATRLDGGSRVPKM